MDLTNVKRFIAVGAHCDDVDLRVGGTFHRLTREGRQGYYVVVTENVFTHADYPRESSRDVLAMRREEAKRGAEVLGAKRVEFLTFKSYYFTPENDPHERIYPTFTGLGSLQDELGNAILDGLPPVLTAIDQPICRRRFETFLDEVQPELVFTHSPDDRHPDHYCVARFVEAVIRERQAEGQAVEVAFWEPGSPLVGFHPNCFIELSDEDVAAKQEALDGYVSQFAKEELEDCAARRTRAYGQLVELPHAEAFHVGFGPTGHAWSQDAGFVEHVVMGSQEHQICRL